jgi:hypothetical protein
MAGTVLYGVGLQQGGLLERAFAGGGGEAVLELRLVDCLLFLLEVQV